MDAVSGVERGAGAAAGREALRGSGVGDGGTDVAVRCGMAANSAVVRARMCFGARPPVRQRK
jgi:hypothetical protein